MKHRYLTILILAISLSAFSQTLFALVPHYQALQFQIIGINNPVAQKNAELALKNLRATLHVPLTKHEADHFYRHAPEMIQKALQPFGYFRSTVSSKLIKEKKYRMAQYTVNVGPGLLIRSVQFEIVGAGKHDHKFIALANTLPFHANGILQTNQFETVKTELYNLATERGYFDAKMIKSQIQISLVRYYANIIIIFNTGPRYRFGETTFTQSPFNDAFLHKFLTYKTGQFYNAKKIEKTKEGLVLSDFFNQVIIKPQTKKAVNHIVPIKVELIPRKAKQYTFGLGYGTDTGFRGTIGVTLRHIGTHGHRFRTLLRASQNNSSLTAKYLIPGWDPAHDQFSIGAGLSNMKQSTGNANNAKFALGYGTTRGHWRNSISLAYLNERYNIVNLPYTSTQLVYPTIDFKYTDSDHPSHPRQGVSFDTQFATASEHILSQTTFSQITAHLNTLYTVNPTNTRLLFRTAAGHTSIANLDSLPLSLQLFAGGSTSVRGYGYNSIGPGRNLVIASTEVQQKIVGEFYAAGFVDAGVVGNQDLFQHINVGTGPGIVLITAIGTMELTYGYAITQSNRPWTVQFMMGTIL